jgi:hypothetical protein
LPVILRSMPCSLFHKPKVAKQYQSRHFI